MLMEYCVLNKWGKFGVKIFSHYADIMIFALGHFILTHPVYNNLCLITESSKVVMAKITKNCHFWQLILIWHTISSEPAQSKLIRISTNWKQLYNFQPVISSKGLSLSCTFQRRDLKAASHWLVSPTSFHLTPWFEVKFLGQTYLAKSKSW